jgi:competence protein ComEC
VNPFLFFLVPFFFFLSGCGGEGYRAPASLRISLLDVGQGLAVLLQTDSVSVLYDTGPAGAGLDTMLTNRGVKHIQTLMLSHNHADHTGGLAEIEASSVLSVGRILRSGELVRGDTVADLRPWSVRVLWPRDSVAFERTENSRSLVLRISDGQDALLLMGDLEQEQEAELLSLEPHLSATVLQVGHHGAETASGWDFLATVRPSWALIGVGKENDYGHPRPGTLAKLRILLPDAANLLRTDVQGAGELEWGYGMGVW